MPPDRLYRTEAIVLRQRDYGEADRILTLLTPGGKISVIAKGIRRATSRKVGHLGLFYRANLLVARGRNLDIVTQAESIEEYEGIRGDLERFAHACYAGELVDRLAPEGEESPALYNLLAEGLRWFAEEEDLRLWMRYYELRLLTHAGYRPELFQCVGCHETLQAQRNYFSCEQGGALCPRCGAEASRAAAMSLNAQKVLRYLLTHGSDEVRALRVSAATHGEIEALLQRYLEYTLEREVLSVGFLRQLRRELGSRRELREGKSTGA